MRFFKDLAINQKLIVFTMGICSITVIASFVIVVLRERTTIKAELVSQAVLAARLTGENCIYSLEFTNSQEATETLAQLEALTAFEDARLYTATGLPFATYQKDSQAPAAPRQVPSHVFSNEFSSSGYLEIFEPILYQRELFGTLYLRVSTRALVKNVRKHLASMVAITAGALLLTWLLALRLGPLITGPIVHLAKITQRITAERDYGIRIGEAQGVEIGQLYEGFNSMLEKIQFEQARLAEFNEMLEERVKDRTGRLEESFHALEATNLELEEANRHKTRFLSTMSHELRTPLNAILGFSNLIRMQHFGPLNTKQYAYIEQVEKSGRHLLELINDLLNVSKIDSGTMELFLSAFSMTSCVEETVTMFKTQADSRNIQFQTLAEPSLPQIYADKRKVKQVLLNLLSNALKYSPDGGRIEMRIERQDNSLRITATDKGIGINQEDHDKIFSEFFQADRQRDEMLGGTGIGLAVCRRLVELHGGTIGLDSTPGQGSSFWFVLPLREPPKEPNAEVLVGTESRHVYIRGKRILVAEDNAVNRAMIIDMLSIHEHKVFMAVNGQEAVEMAHRQNPDLILMDIRMPIMGGLEATRQLRQTHLFDKVPIIALTASVEPESKALCLDAGCSTHLAKPIQAQELFQAIAQALGQKE